MAGCGGQGRLRVGPRCGYAVTALTVVVVSDDSLAPAAPAASLRERPAAPAAPAARIENLTKVYGSGDTAVHALDGVTLDFVAGEFTAIMGPSGSGKSTLMHCAAGLDSVTSGQVFLGDVDLTTLKDAALTKTRRDHIGFVFQAFNLIPTLTAEENIRLPLAIAGASPDPQWFDAVIDAVGLQDRLDHRPGELSGGQQQRVACARALLSRPQIVFADEPTGNLDSTSGAEVLGFLRRCVDEFGQTIVMVTHDAGAAAWTDRVVFLADGQIVTELREPTADAVLETMKQLDPRHTHRLDSPTGPSRDADQPMAAGEAEPKPQAR